MLILVCMFISLRCVAEAIWGAPTRRWLLAAVGVVAGAIAVGIMLQRGHLMHSVARLVMPTGLLWLAGLSAIAVLLAKRARRAAVLATLLWVFYTLAGSTYTGHILLHATERAYAHIDPFAETYDVVHVLGGGTHTHEHYAQLASSGDRVMLGARLFHQNNTPLLLTTGSTAANSSSPHNSAEVTRQLWTDLGIPDDRILTIPHPTNTYEEMQLLKELQETHRWQRIGVVSSARHLTRVLQNAERAGVDISPLPADFRSTSGAWIPSFDALIPTGMGFLLVHNAAWEWLARTARR